jgi:hypothetical protein
MPTVRDICLYLQEMIGRKKEHLEEKYVPLVDIKQTQESSSSEPVKTEEVIVEENPVPIEEPIVLSEKTKTKLTIEIPEESEEEQEYDWESEMIEIEKKRIAHFFQTKEHEHGFHFNSDDDEDF